MISETGPLTNLGRRKFSLSRPALSVFITALSIHVHGFVKRLGFFVGRETDIDAGRIPKLHGVQHGTDQRRSERRH